MFFSYINIKKISDGTIVTFDAVDVDAIELIYNGGDDKIVSMMPSQLNVSFVDISATPNRYKFLSDNHNDYYIEVFFDDQSWGGPVALWKGKIVPSEYQEPVTSINTVVSFTATDGLAELKEYIVYNEGEILLVDFIQKILNETGLGSRFKLFPAIRNRLIGWEAVKIDTLKFENLTYYEALDDILTSMLCTIHYYNGYWYIVGINQKNLPVDYAITGIRYDENGSAQIEELRHIKSFQYVPDPQISYLQPVKKITIETEEKDIKIDDLSAVENKYIPIPLSFSNDKIISPKWYEVGNISVELKELYIYDDFKFTQKKPGYLSTIINSDDVINEGNYITYNHFVKKGDIIEIDADILARYDHDMDGNFNGTFTTDNFRFKFKLNNDVVSANFETSEGYIPTDADVEKISAFKEDKANIVFKYKALNSGLFQIYIYAYKELIIDKFDFSISVSNKDYTIDNNGQYNFEKKLNVIPDVRLEVKSFKIIEPATTYTKTYHQQILATFIKDNLNYLIITPETASIYDRWRNVSCNGNDVNVIDLVYNLYGGEQIVIITDDLTIDSSCTLDIVANYTNDIVDLNVYGEWVDTYYNIGRDEYIEAYAAIIKRLQEKEFSIIDSTIYGFLMPLDVMSFDYDKDRLYIPSNLTINLLRRETTVRAHELSYRVDSASPVPIKLYAASPIIIDENVSDIDLVAEIFDAKSAVNYNWIMDIGSTGTITDPNALSTSVTGLEDSYYVFILNADNGLTNDSVAVEVIRKNTKTFAMTLLSHTNPDSVCNHLYQYRLDLSQQLQYADIWLMQIHIKINGLGNLTIYKNGLKIDELPGVPEHRFKISLMKNDVITFDMLHLDCCDDNANCLGWSTVFNVDIEDVDIVSGIDYAITLPFNFELTSPES